MDPVGPWSAYASYNRLAGVQAGSGSGELHHHLPTPGATGAPSTTTAQLLPGSFLSPTPVGYETVFSPLFHHAGTKPAAHYVSQHRALASKQSAESEYHQTQAFFEQSAGAWQQNSPFGILPHESVVPTTTGKTAAYENFNAHFAAAQSLNHLNSQLAAAKTTATRAQSPQVSTTTSKPSQATSSGTFFQVPATFAGADNSTTTKSFSSSNSSNIQQSCIVSSPTNTSVTKEYRVPQAPARAYLTSPNPQRPIKQSTPTQIQTKAQTKIYPELGSQTERQRNNEETQSQSSPISFSIMDAPGRLSYAGSNSSAKRTQFQHNYRHYPQQNATSEQDFQRPKSGSDYNSNGPDCNVVVPRRPSPLQAHSQASPLGHAPSPAYPMYNSPMNSISSPQQSSSNQVTPPSPLDVSVPRPTSQGNVAYPSVITRTLNTDKAFPERYDRPQQQNNQNCWEERQQTRKFQGGTQSNNYSSGNSIEMPARQIELAARNEQSQQRVAGLMTERQQTYFDSNTGHQVTLQDLSSCRGDPMSIVKNLQQQQQQSCQVPQIEIKQEAKAPVKRRKSSDKQPTDVPGRIPPPAHSSGAQNQQQNGAYFDFDRWNLPPPSSKIFTTQTIHQQHQGLMVPHPHGHHPPPPLPYFAPFHLPPHPAEFPATVELTPISNYAENTQPSSQFQQQEDQPKVVVPNIEEELNFLSQGNTTRAPANNSINKPIVPNSMTKVTDKPTGPGSGFMSSYLKFLQGERDSSPPPATRGNRKQTTWTRSKPLLNNEDKPPDSNGMVQHVPPPPPPVTTRLSQGDPQDDPRYFPLPKERKRNSFDSDSDGISSDDDFFGNNKKFNYPSKDDRKEKGSRKSRSTKTSGADRKRAKKSSNKEKNKEPREDTEVIPRRESTKRAAKEKTNFQHLIKGDDDIEEPPEFQDSDSDPAWTPQAKEDGEEIIPISKKCRKSSAKKRRNLITAAAQGAGIQEIDGYVSDSSAKKSKGNKSKQNTPPTLEDNIAASLPNNTLIVNDDNPFKPGEFVVIRSELNQDWPAIWRVDGKTLLQKYEPFEQNGLTLYRNISTYTSWTPESKKQYISIPVKYKCQNQLETIVEFLRNEMTVIDHDYQEKCMKDCEGYQDNFEVYIQTLISQALDSNFLTEIFQEKDEYFLSNVKTIDDITDSKKKKLLSLLRWPPAVQAAVCTWPCFNVIREVNPTDAHTKNCAACSRHEVAVRVLMYGQPYNSTTLEGCQPDPKAMNEKVSLFEHCDIINDF
ncbi:uncharacterized protein BDFB_003340 [Asbolus verrucosus]|uniref:DUF4211 domain-containing protein n=1 Tax=Asbolus verrucosus TaxID=1661398 RepID=A0A482VJ55_ASBVE|nr:uncharacterized protein BDFB_003340 [Asbolus verrucosus]